MSEKVKNFVTLFFILVLAAGVVLGQQIITLSWANQSKKQDYTQINNIKYGLFSVNQWKEQISEIIQAEIKHLDISSNKKQLKPLIEAQLTQLIDGVDKKIREKNKKTFKGKLKQAFINAFVDMNDIKEGVPQYADDIIKLSEKPSTKEKITGLLLDKVASYLDKTYEKQDLSRLNKIIERAGASDLAEAKVKINEEIARTQARIFSLTGTLLALTVLVFVIAGLSVPLRSTHYIILVALLSILLIAGVTTPMIDLEAKISEMSFVLFDHPVRFLDQVLYFQTKSVLDVFWIMMVNPAIEMKIVGILIITFSVIFPVVKLLSSIFYYYDYGKLSQNRVVQFFVFKSGKWSMTDVMVIAIFMAYIGFNGIIGSQFKKLQSTHEEIVLLTTNGTSLQPGFYLFLGYALLALFLSEMLMRRHMRVGQQTK